MTNRLDIEATKIGMDVAVTPLRLPVGMTNRGTICRYASNGDDLLVLIAWQDGSRGWHSQADLREPHSADTDTTTKQGSTA